MEIQPNFRPTLINGCVLWLAADLITGLADAAAVGTWTDLSDVGNTVTQATADNKPLYKVGIVAGKPVVRADGTDDWLAKATPSLPSGNAAFTIAAVLVPRRVSHTDAQNIFNFGAEVAHQLVYLINPVSTTNLVLEWWGGNGTITATSVLAAGTPLIAVATYTSTVAELLVNGVSKGTAEYSSSNLGTATLSIGRYSGGQYAQFDYAELAVWNRALGAGERGRLERHLGRKWSVGVQ